MSIRVYTLLFLVAPAGLWGAPKSDISTPQQRAQTIELARTLLTTKQADISADEIDAKNPFFRKAPVVMVETPASDTPEVPMATGKEDRDLLAEMAAGVTPSGTIRLGDTQYLLFGQKKLKIGDVVPIVFQGTNYELHLTGIERTSFTLRLNKEEITRPIKP